MAAASCAALALWLSLGPPVKAAAQGAESIGFTATQSGVPLQGRFETFHAQLDFDPQHPQAGSVHVVVDTGSVEAGASQTNALLRSGAFLDAGHHAQSRFDASDFVDQGGGRYLARGTFALKDRTSMLPVAFTAASGPQGLVIDGGFTISRLAFSVGEGEWADTGTVDDPVVVHFHLVGTPTRP